MSEYITLEMAERLTSGVIKAMNGESVLLIFRNQWRADKAFDIAMDTTSIWKGGAQCDEHLRTFLYQDGGVLIFGTEEVETHVDTTIKIDE
jgi:hypothetical protein